jgi:aminopeptidase N
MKRKLLYLLSLALLAACSAPKYSYNFDHYNYKGGKKKSVAAEENVVMQGPEVVKAEELVASSSKTAVILPEVAAEKKTEMRKTYAQMNKSERKEVRKQIKTAVKSYVKAKKDNLKTNQATKRMDNDLKLAAIFGAVGIVALIIGGDVFWIIGGIALLIGVVFFVKWLIRQ